jgi:hypothetical protein
VLVIDSALLEVTFGGVPGKQEAIDEIVVVVEITHGIPLIND